MRSAAVLLNVSGVRQNVSSDRKRRHTAGETQKR